jgi:phospholipid transport system substrate-binding protein
MNQLATRSISMRSLLLVCALSAPALAMASPSNGPMETLKSENTQVEKLLRMDVPKDSPQDKKNKDQVKQHAAALLDYDELAQKAMDQHWSQLKPAQQKEFQSTFKEMLEKNYVKQLKTNLDYQVQYKDEKLASDDQAIVQTIIKVKTKGKSTDAEIVYKMHRVPGGWMVWDIITDEVSLLRNYKTQFHKIITEQGYDKLLEKMKNKLKEQT